MKLCEHCKRKLKEAGELPPEWPEDEKRIDVIGTNGGTGEHYQIETREAWNDSFDEGER